MTNLKVDVQNMITRLCNSSNDQKYCKQHPSLSFNILKSERKYLEESKEIKQNWTGSKNLHCVKSVRIRSFYGPYTYSVQTQGNAHQKNSEYEQFSLSFDIYFFT